MSTRSDLAEAALRPGELHAIPPASARSVIARIEKDAAVPAATAQRWFDEMLRFLGLAATAPRLHRFVPSPPVDEAWHAFILHTQDYMTYCEALGGYVHHRPFAPGDDPMTRFSWIVNYWETRLAMLERYGELDEALWPVVPERHER